MHLLYGLSVGTGTALATALDDDREIFKIVWMTQPVQDLPAALRALQVVHSFLKVTVMEVDGGSVDEYIIEKCETDEENIECGVLVSWWNQAQANYQHFLPMPLVYPAFLAFNLSVQNITDETGEVRIIAMLNTLSDLERNLMLSYMPACVLGFVV